VKEGGVLVHCFSGISRSPAIVAAYLMRAYLIDYETAIKRIKAKRFFVAPIDGFVKQLRIY
jgi:protein-tyrosine phosphatase